MELRELLDELRTNVLRDVSTVMNGDDADQLWSDATLVRYLRDAEEKFAAGTLCLRDSITPALTQLTMVSGQADYVLDKRVIDIYSVQYIGRDNRSNLAATSYANRFGARAELTPTMAYDEPRQEGPPRMYYTDLDTGMVGFYPVPGDDEVPYTVRLQVARRPLKPLNANDLDASPEIPDEYHLDLVEWACWRALRNHDADIDGDPANISIVMARSSSHKKRFEDAVAECRRKMKYMTKQAVQFSPLANWS